MRDKIVFFILGAVLATFFSCSIPQTEPQTDFSPILVRRYNAEIDLGKEQISNNPQFAIEYFNSAIEKNLNLPEAFAGRGAARLALGQYALAITDLDLALEADWSHYDLLRSDYDVAKSNIYWWQALAGIGLLKTIDAKEDLQTWVLTFANIDGDLSLAEFHAGLAQDHELMKRIIETRHLFETAK